MLGILSGLIAGAAMYDRMGAWSFLVMVPAVYCGVMFCSYEDEIPEQWRVFAAGLVICAVCSGRMLYVFTRPQPQNITLTQESGTVQSVRTWGRNYAIVIDADNGERYVTRLRFSEYMPGDRILFDGVTRSFRPRDKYSSFDDARFWGARGVTSWISLYNVKELPAKFSLPRMRAVISRKLTMYMPNAVSAYLKAAWIGERDELLTQMHRRWGTVHLLAVSGFHVGIVILWASFLFGMRPVILSVIFWAYVLLTGAAPSALRAGLMIQAGLISRMLGRPVSGVNVVSVAGVSILMYSPLMFWDIGFRLSMVAAMVISTFTYRKFTWLIISPVVSLATFPQVSYTFGEIVLVGLVLNIIAPAYFAIALTDASGFGILRLLNVPFMKFMMFVCEGIFIIWEKTADFAAELIPYSMGWNWLTAWIGSGTVIFCVCRYFGFAPLRIAVVMIAGSFLAFVMFL